MIYRLINPKDTIVKHVGFMDQLYLNRGDVEKAAKAANLLLPKNHVSPSSEARKEVGDLKDLISKAKTGNGAIFSIDSVPKY